LSARRISYQPHNFYVELLVTQGLAGLVSFLALVFAALRATWTARRHAEYGPAARWLFVMLVFQLGYYTTYGVEYMQTLFLGVALALAASLRAIAQPQGATKTGATKRSGTAAASGAFTG
jgi:O-antigen ligase